ncbi:MAG: hypothetical protein V7K33_26810 [Nostoc sp.]
MRDCVSVARRRYRFRIVHRLSDRISFISSDRFRILPKLSQ